MPTLQRKITKTADGSSTIFIPDWNEHYHSHHGAIQEAQHVFVDNGLRLLDKDEITVIELGFGTGLNALISSQFAENNRKKIHYITIEKYPLQFAEVVDLNYHQQLYINQLKFIHLHQTNWESEVKISNYFWLTKYQTDFFSLEMINDNIADIVFFDCFGARVQPELWKKPLLEIIKKKMKENALLTTYSSKGSFRRALIELGFEVEKKQGPKGKREMLIGWKR